MKILLAIGLAIAALLLFLGPAQADVCLNGVTCVSTPVVTTTVRVPVPGPTTTVRLPGPTKTVYYPVPGPTKTVDNPVPGPVSTVTVTRTITQSGQQSTKRVTIVPTPGPTVTKTVRARGRVVTVTQAVGLSLGFLLLGFVIGLSALFLAYYVGQKDARLDDNKKLRDFANELFGKR